MGRRKTISDSELLSAARDAFVELGTGVSMRDVAKRAGVSEGVLFQRFGTKGELLLAAMVPTPYRFPGNTPTGRAPKSARRRLARLVLDLTAYFREATPVFLPLMSDPTFDFEAFARRHPDASLAALRRDLVQHLASERSAGRLGPVESGPAALAIIAIAQTVALFERLGAHGGRLPDWLVEDAAGCLWEGLAPRRSVSTARRPRAGRPHDDHGSGGAKTTRKRSRRMK